MRGTDGTEKEAEQGCGLSQRASVDPKGPHCITELVPLEAQGLVFCTSLSVESLDASCWDREDSYETLTANILFLSF